MDLITLRPEEQARLFGHFYDALYLESVWSAVCFYRQLGFHEVDHTVPMICRANPLPPRWRPLDGFSFRVPNPAWAVQKQLVMGHRSYAPDFDLQSADAFIDTDAGEGWALVGAKCSRHSGGREDYCPEFHMTHYHEHWPDGAAEVAEAAPGSGIYIVRATSQGAYTSFYDDVVSYLGAFDTEKGKKIESDELQGVGDADLPAQQTRLAFGAARLTA